MKLYIMDEADLPVPDKTPVDLSKARKVLVRVVFLRVGAIDTVEETYDADVIVQAKWRESTLDHSTIKDLQTITSPNLWKPQLQIQNLITEGKTRTTTEVEFNSRREAFLIETRKIRGTFSEHLELYNFPFDVQDLSLLITSELRQSEIILVEDEKELSRINPMGFVDIQEWELRDYIATTTDPTYEIVGHTRKYPTLVFNFAAFRRPGFFIWNIIFIMALITSLSLTTFAVKFDLPQHRLQMTFTLLLTAVAFKFVVAQSLPKIPYLTYLDIHILGCMIILYIVCIWHGIITLIDNYHLTAIPDLDMAAVIIVGVMFVLFHIIFGLIVYKTTSARKREIYEAETVYQTKALAVYGENYTKLKRMPVRRLLKAPRSSRIFP